MDIRRIFSGEKRKRVHTCQCLVSFNVGLSSLHIHISASKDHLLLLRQQTFCLSFCFMVPFFFFLSCEDCKLARCLSLERKREAGNYDKPSVIFHLSGCTSVVKLSKHIRGRTTGVFMKCRRCCCPTGSCVKPPLEFLHVSPLISGHVVVP